VSVIAEHLGLRLGKKTVIDDVSIDVASGTWCTIVGPNGAGKTSLLAAIAGLRRPHIGSVQIDGVAIESLNERARAQRVAFVPQSPVVPAGMNVADYIMLGRQSSHGLLRAPATFDRQIVGGVIERLDLIDLRTRDVATLSGGERQRVVLARALAQGTRTILLDEPTTGLDVRHQMDILELLRKEVDECELTVVATLHDLTQAGLFADHMVLLRDGQVRAAGAPADVVRSSALSESYGTTLHVVEVDGRDVVIAGRPVGADK